MRRTPSSRIPPSGEQFALVHGDQSAVVVEVGGGLREYSVGGRAVLDGYAPDEMCRSGRGQVLMPWPNRIEDGHYEFDGLELQLPLTEPTAGNAIHGLVRWTPWTLAEQQVDRIVLKHLLHPQPGYPFTLALRIEYVLDDFGLTVRTTATNVGDDPCPFGSGQHPYLTVGTETVDAIMLHVPARTFLESSGDAHSVDGTAFDFRSPRRLGETVLDNAFTDLERDADGIARVGLREEESGVELNVWADECYTHLQVFTGDPLPDVARRSVAVEPMTCPANAFRTGKDVVRLEPGESWAGAWGIT